MHKGLKMQRLCDDLSVIGTATIGLICHSIELLSENADKIIVWATMIYVVVRAYREVKRLIKEHKRGFKNVHRKR